MDIGSMGGGGGGGGGMSGAMQGIGGGMKMAGDIITILETGDRKKQLEQLLKEFTALDLGTEQQKSIANNLSALPMATNLAGKTNKASQQLHDKALAASIPEYAQLRSQQLGIINKMYDPEYLAKETRRYSAAQGIQSGTAGSGFNEATFARQYGRSLTDVMGKKLSSLDSWLQSAYQMQKAPEMNLTSMFVSPMQQYEVDNQQQQQQLAMRLGVISAPTELEAWGKTLQQRGAEFSGMGSSMPSFSPKQSGPSFKDIDYDLSSSAASGAAQEGWYDPNS